MFCLLIISATISLSIANNLGRKTYTIFPRRNFVREWKKWDEDCYLQISAIMFHKSSEILGKQEFSRTCIENTQMNLLILWQQENRNYTGGQTPSGRYWKSWRAYSSWQRSKNSEKKKIKKENRSIFDFGKQRNNTDVTEKQNKMLQQQIKDFWMKSKWKNIYSKIQVYDVIYKAQNHLVWTQRAYTGDKEDGKEQFSDL